MSLSPNELVDRWKTQEGRRLRETVLDALMSNASLPQALFDLAGANEVFDRFDLRGFDFDGLSLTNAMLATASLDFASMRRCQFTHTFFDNSILVYSEMADALFVECQFCMARITRTEFSQSVFDRCLFMHSECYGGTFDRSQMTGCDWSNARLICTKFRSGTFQGTTFRKATLWSCDFSGARYEDSTFLDANVRQTQL
jgi:uncharacterized protein YjbI with pentapeptide repeats